jgi:predicted murein hydrolase (TIGR00659 family)
MIEMLSQIQAHPIFGILATVAAYWLAATAWSRFGNPALLHPVLVATALLGIMLVVTGMDYGTYFRQSFLLNETLGLVIVLLAVPLYRQFGLISTAGTPLACALIAGSVVAIMTALVLPWYAGAADEVLATLAPKSTTAAVAVEITDRLGGISGLTAVIVISTGIFGAAFGPTILRLAGIDDERAAGFALGVASHAIGTARAFQISEVAGAFASLGMILNALLTIALVPLVLALLAA